MGLVKFTRAGFAQVARFVASLSTGVDCLDMTGLLRGLIARGNWVQARTVNGFWYEVDNINDVKMFSRWVERHHWREVYH